MTEDRVRVLRVIEYVGPRAWVETTVAKSVHGTEEIGPGRFIHAATVGTYPEILAPVPATATTTTAPND